MVNLAQPRPSVRQYPEKRLRQLREFCAKRHRDILRESEDRARNRHVKSAFSDLWSFRGITFHTPKLGIMRIDLLLRNSVFVSAINALSPHKRKCLNSFETRDAPSFGQPSPKAAHLQHMRRSSPGGTSQRTTVEVRRCRFRLTARRLLLDDCDAWTSNALLTRLSSYTKCSKRRT